jgi:molybdopterin/thiamine biosynthesis adenylyltransferase
MKELAKTIQEKFPAKDLSFLNRSGYSEFFIDTSAKEWTAYWIHDQKKPPFKFATLLAPAPAVRLPSIMAELPKKTVSIIGCGSIGSKVAVSLARSGVRNFILIDDDIFHEDNCVRNQLDCMAIGLHKVDAVEQGIKRLPGIYEITKKRAGLGRQNSALRTNALMENLSESDIIIDCTASPRAFNYAASVSRRRKIPLVRCSVFSGGIGGLLFRCRPNLDPTPAKAMAQIKNWRAERPEQWVEDDSLDPYAYTIDEAVMVASDAHISIMAGYCCDMAIDTLADLNSTMFPQSAYAIGFSNEWAFNQPFHNIPIGFYMEGDWGDTVSTSKEESTEALQGLFRLIMPKEET